MSLESELLQKECRERFPGLLEELPVHSYVTLLRRLPASAAYHRVPEAVRAWCRKLEGRYSRAALGLVHRLLLAHFLDHPGDRAWPIRLTPEARELQESELRRIRKELLSAPPEYYETFNDPFLKDLGLASGRLLHLGAQMIEPASRLPKRILFLRNPLRTAGALIRIFRGGGALGTYFQLHTSERHLDEFTEDGWRALYRTLAALLELNPGVQGVFSVSWYFDPALVTISPRLSYLRELPVRHGAFTLLASRDPGHARLAALKSPTRRELMRTGRYEPAGHLFVWPRRALIRREADYGLMRLRRRIKLGALRLLKAAGAFHLSKRLARRKLRILCYHGFAEADQHEFDDTLFLRQETFARRMRLLESWGLAVIPLREAVAALPSNAHPDHAAVITFDDGWRSVTRALPVLEHHGFASTLYVATYYAVQGESVFNVLVRYVFWKTRAERFESFDLGDPAERATAATLVIQRGEALDTPARKSLLESVAAGLGVKVAPLEERGMFRYLSIDELRELPPRLMDLELHTHRHDLPTGRDGMTREISDNRAALQKVRPGAYEHICYPSGIFSEGQFAVLQSLGIRSGTTVENCLNDRDTPLLRLGRFVDRDTLSDLEFEAEITGTAALLRKLFRGWAP